MRTATKFAIALVILLSASCFASTVTHRISTASTTGGTSLVSGAFTPAAGELLIAFVTASGTTGTGSMTDAQNLGWSLITSVLKNSSADTIYAFVSNHTAAASSMTVTFTDTAASTGYVIQVAGVSGMTRTGLGAILQKATQANQAAAGTPALAFASAVQTGNPTLGVVGNSTNVAGMTPPTSWTEQNDTGFATPTTGAEYVSRDSGFTGTTVTWGSTSASAFGDIIVELDTSAPTAGSIAFVRQATNSAATSSSLVVTITAPNAGDALVLFSTNNNASITAVSGGGVTWVSGNVGGDGHIITSIWYGLNSSGSGTSITITYADATGNPAANVSEFSNVATASAVDVSPSETNASTVNPYSPAAVTTNADDLIVAVAGSNATVSAGPSDSFTGLTQVASSSNRTIPAYLSVNATGTYNTGWLTSSNSWDVHILALKAAVSSGTKVFFNSGNVVLTSKSPNIVFRPLDVNQGASLATAVTNSQTGAITSQNLNSGNTQTKTAGGVITMWVSHPLSSAVTIAGTITPNIWALESNASCNCGLRYEVFKWDHTNGGLYSMGISTNDGVTEFGTSAAVRTAPTLTPASTAFAVGDRIAVAIYNDDANAVTEASGQTWTMDYSAATGVDGDSYLSFTETLTMSADSNTTPPMVGSN